MTDDIRISICFRDHPKRAYLTARLGPTADTHLLDFLLLVRTQRPSGVLRGWESFHIAHAGRYPGDPDEFVAALMDAGFLELNDGVYEVHDWAHWQPYAAHAERRSLQAKLAAAKRWDNTPEYNRLYKVLYNQDPNAESIANANRPASEGHANSNAPYPYPYPDPKQRNADSMRCACGKKKENPRFKLCSTCYRATLNQTTTKQYTFPKCPYCNMEANSVRVDDTVKGCNYCKPNLVD